MPIEEIIACIMYDAQRMQELMGPRPVTILVTSSLFYRLAMANCVFIEKMKPDATLCGFPIKWIAGDGDDWYVAIGRIKPKEETV